MIFKFKILIFERNVIFEKRRNLLKYKCRKRFLDYEGKTIEGWRGLGERCNIFLND